MRLYELVENKNWSKTIIDSFLLTIIDPKLPGARKSDCYAVCAYAIRNGEVPDNADFVIYGYVDNPMHGVIQDGDTIIVDKFNDSLMSHDGDAVRYDDWNETLHVVSKFKVSDIKRMCQEKYKMLAMNKY